MSELVKHLSADKRQRLFYAIAANVPFAEKSKLIAQFVALHAERKYWGVRMHMTKRSMPFTIHATVSFRATNKSVNKLVLHLDQTTIGKNVEEVKLVWHHMQSHMLRVSPAQQKQS
ncbi:MAG: hypothetical protein ACRYG7_39455 [Janthinobacterium lividum]